MSHSPLKILAPFYSEDLLSGIRVFICLSGLILFVFWPKASFPEFAYANGSPIVLPVFFIFSLVWISHHLLAYGAGEYQKESSHAVDQTEPLNPAVILRLARHSLLIHTLVLPLYTITATVSGISITIFMFTLLLLAVTGFTSGLIGLLSQLVFNRESLTCFLLSRTFFCFLIFLSGWLDPRINPIYILFKLYKSHRYTDLIMENVTICLASMSGAAILLIILNFGAAVYHGKTKKGTNESH